MENLTFLAQTALEILKQELETVTGTPVEITINVHQVPIKYFPEDKRIVPINDNKHCLAHTNGDVVFFSKEIIG